MTFKIMWTHNNSIILSYFIALSSDIYMTKSWYKTYLFTQHTYLHTIYNVAIKSFVLAVLNYTF